MRGFVFLGRTLRQPCQKPAHNPPAAAGGVAGWRLRWASAAGRAGAGLWGGLGPRAVPPTGVRCWAVCCATWPTTRLLRGQPLELGVHEGTHQQDQAELHRLGDPAVKFAARHAPAGIALGIAFQLQVAAVAASNGSTARHSR